jgi:hypothetical protein
MEQNQKRAIPAVIADMIPTSNNTWMTTTGS